MAHTAKVCGPSFLCSAPKCSARVCVCAFFPTLALVRVPRADCVKPVCVSQVCSSSIFSFAAGKWEGRAKREKHGKTHIHVQWSVRKANGGCSEISRCFDSLVGGSVLSVGTQGSGCGWVGVYVCVTERGVVLIQTSGVFFASHNSEEVALESQFDSFL